jgi:hypothetical protein
MGGSRAGLFAERHAGACGVAVGAGPLVQGRRWQSVREATAIAPWAPPPWALSSHGGQV